MNYQDPDDKSKKIMTKFTIGKQQISLWGNILTMAQKSDYFRSLFDFYNEEENMSDIKLAGNLDVDLISLLPFWKYLNEDINYMDVDISSMTDDEVSRFMNTVTYMLLYFGDFFNSQTKTEFVDMLLQEIQSDDRTLEMRNQIITVIVNDFWRKRLVLNKKEAAEDHENTIKLATEQTNTMANLAQQNHNLQQQVNALRTNLNNTILNYNNYHNKTKNNWLYHGTIGIGIGLSIGYLISLIKKN
jgi:hypothetical protein